MKAKIQKDRDGTINVIGGRLLPLAKVHVNSIVNSETPEETERRVQEAIKCASTGRRRRANA